MKSRRHTPSRIERRSLSFQGTKKPSLLGGKRLGGCALCARYREGTSTEGMMFRWGNRLNNVITFHDYKSSDLFALGKSKVSSLTDLLPIVSVE